MKNPTPSIIREISQVLLPVCGESSLYEAEQILQFVFQCSRSDLYLNNKGIYKEPVSNETRLQLDAIVKRRLNDEPLAYVLGRTFFYSKDIIVTPHVLIPRQETETLVDLVLNNIHNHEAMNFLDICTGSGAIAAVLTDQRQNWIGYASDISKTAVAIAKVNNRDQTKVWCSDLFAAISPRKKHFFDFIVCNPPYIALNEMPGLDKSVLQYEPVLALLGGIDGLDFYRRIASESLFFLKPHGKIYCEIGFSQGESVYDLFSMQNWRNVQIHKDIAQRPRVISAEKI